MQAFTLSDEDDREARNTVIAVVARRRQQRDKSVNPPLLGRSKLLGHFHDTACEEALLLCGSSHEVVEQLWGQNASILVVHQLENQLHGADSDGNIGILQALNDGRAVSLHCGRIDRNSAGWGKSGS